MQREQKDREFGREEAQNAAWNAFYRTGKVEDYIRYAQMKAHARATGETDDDEDERIDYPGAGGR